MKKRAVIAFFTLFFLFTIRIGAESNTYEEFYTLSDFNVDSILDALPDSMISRLPEGDIFSSEGFERRFSVEFFIDYIKQLFFETLSPCIKSFAATLSLLLISSVLSMFKKSVQNDGTSVVFGFACSLSLILALYNEAVVLTESIKLYIERLSSVVSAMVPVTAAIGTAGGNLSSSAVSASGMMLGLALVENLASGALMPILQLCFGLSSASCMEGGINLSGISRLLRGAFTFVISLCSAIISAVMTFQTSIAAHADSLSMRAVKFAAVNAVPVAGGIAGEAVRAVAGSLSLIKSTVGWVGVILIIMHTLPITVKILLLRFGIKLSETAADIMGLEKEKGILSDIGGLYGFLGAVCVISGLMFVYAMAIFAKSTFSV